MEALAHTLPYEVTLMGGTQAGTPLPQERWAGAKAPALVIVGGASPPWLHAGAKQLVERLQRAELLVLEGTDHSVAIMAPQAIAPTLIEFLGG
jgi:pimeloyl-ACP methyl ester carboxylesterase